MLEVFHTIHGVTGFEVSDAEHVLVTEYAPDASIVDRPVFGNVMGLSLGSACTFRLRKSDFSDDAAGRLC